MYSKISLVWILSVLIGIAFSWDGCEYNGAWRCGNLCINWDSECKCGDSIFNQGEQMWCCQNDMCTGNNWSKKYNSWMGEFEEGRKIGANCSGKALKLSQACNNTCNFYEHDQDRNYDLLRGFMPCNVSTMRITQCIAEGKRGNGKFDCDNRWDESPFKTHFDNSSSLLMDLDNLMIPCSVAGVQGFKCSGYTNNGHCLPISRWCNQRSIYKCKELEGRSPTGKTVDFLLCSNQTYWEKKGCNNKGYRCIGETPGQCSYDGCIDGSSQIMSTQSKNCGGNLTCIARDGRWAGTEICLDKKFLCDNHLQCENGEDERGCDREYLRRRVFTKDQHYICKTPYLVIKDAQNTTGRFYPIRAVRSTQLSFHHQHHHHHHDQD